VYASIYVFVRKLLTSGFDVWMMTKIAMQKFSTRAHDCLQKGCLLKTRCTPQFSQTTPGAPSGFPDMKHVDKRGQGLTCKVSICVRNAKRKEGKVVRRKTVQTRLQRVEEVLSLSLSLW
jgi:hypothetical protein